MKPITLITGGSSGLGLELAKLYAKDGDLCLTAREAVRLHRAAELCKAGNAVASVAADCSKEEDIKRLFDFIHGSGFYVARLINCAGIGRFGEPAQNDEAMIRSVIDCNLVSTMLATTYALRDMEERGKGEIITILSTAAQIGKPDESVYCAAKWGARGYCEALKTAYRDTDIRILTVSPGGINTPFWSEDCGKQVNVSSFMDPGELAKTIYAAASAKNSLFCTDLIVDKH